MRWLVYILLPLQLLGQESYTNCSDIIPQNYQVTYDADKIYYWDISGGEILYDLCHISNCFFPNSLIIVL